MKNVSKKVRNMIIDRFFIATNELPHAISFSHNEDNWKIFKLQSANYIHEIGYKALHGGEVALFS
jgi:hypothetical protein